MSRHSMIPIRVVVVLVLAAAPAWAAEHGAEVRINGDAVEAGYLRWFHGGDALWGLSWLHGDDGDVVSSSLHVTGPISTKPKLSKLRAGVGGEAVGLDGDGDSEVGLALGGFAELSWPSHDRFELRLAAHYAPDILLTGDAESFHRVGVEAGYRVLRKAKVFVGARSVEVDFGHGRATAEIDSGLHGGFRVWF